MGDLGGGPAELEDDDEGDEVDEAGPLWRVEITADTLVKDEGEGQQDADSSWKKAQHKQREVLMAVSRHRSLRRTRYTPRLDSTRV